MRLRSKPAGKQHHKRTPAAALPAVGSEVQVDVVLTGNVRTAASVHQIAASASGGSIEGVVAGTPGSTLRIAAGRTVVTLQVDTTTLDLSDVQSGQRVLAYFARQPDGTLSLLALAQDGTAADADDAGSIVGDVAGANATIDGTDAPCTVDGTSADDGSSGPVDDGSNDQGDDGDGSGTLDTSNPTDDGTAAGDQGSTQPSACGTDDGSGDDTGNGDGSDGSDGASDSGSLDS